MKWITFVLMLLAPGAALAAGDAALDRATLRGLKSVGVIIDNLDADLVRQGLTPGDLQTRIAQRLGAGGITVDKSATEFVGLRMIQVHDKKGPYALCISIGAYQPVVLVRDKNVKTATQTWEVETVLMADPKQLQEAALSSVDDLVDRFLAAWKSAAQ